MTAINVTAHDDTHHHDMGEAKVFGFWIYLMSDCILFATLFATYAVVANNIVNGPGAKDIFELPYVLKETMCLLFSSVTFGMAMLAMFRGNKGQTQLWMFITFLFGIGFVCMEINEFHHLIVQGYTPEHSAFLSGFFTLVGTHGLHVTAGLIWMVVMMIHIAKNGITKRNNMRMMCLSLFWHFLDVVWICVFSLVYLIGVMK